MASTTTITFPSVANPATAHWGLTRNDASFVSPMNGYTQDLERAGARWVCTLAWAVLSDTDIAKLQSWLVRMSKAGIRTRLPNYGYTRHGVGGGTPLVNGGSQTGTSLITDGWPNSTLVVKDGDLIQLATGQLVMAVADGTSDGSGNLTLSIEPKLRSSPADNSALTLSSPTALFKLPNPKFDVGYVPSNPNPKAALQIDLIEDPQ